MALLRLIAPCLALAACGRSEAAPGSGITPPPGWRAAPALAKATADAAKADAIAVTASEAWSEPQMGCYGVWLSLAGGASAIDAAADQLLASLEKQGITVKDVVKPAAGDRGVLTLGFAKPPYRGALRAELAKTGTVAALACLWNQREPKACEAACTKLVGGAR